MNLWFNKKYEVNPITFSGSLYKSIRFRKSLVFKEIPSLQLLVKFDKTSSLSKLFVSQVFIHLWFVKIMLVSVLSDF